MSADLWLLVAEKLNEHDYMDGVERTVERVRATGEVFTPSALVIEMLQYTSLEILSPGKTVLDPACGDGQFLTAAKWVKVFHFGMTESDALLEIFGVDLMRDNVDLCRRRLGGGTILLGNSLDPFRRVPGQTDDEYRLMTTLFDAAGSRSRKKSRVAKRADPQSRPAQEPSAIQSPLF